MAMKRNYLVSNAMLLKIMRKSGIPAYIRSNSIVTGAGDRIAPGLQLARVPQQLASAPTKRDATVQSDKGDGSAPSSRAVDDSVGNESEATHRAEQAGHQFLGNKTVSDVCEAIIGAAWLSGGVELALRCIKKIGLPLDKIDRWRDLKEHSQIPSPPDNIQLAQSVTVEMQEIIGLQLARPELLAWALTHGSATLQVHTPHQWLEFVGDGLLDYLVVPDIYNAHPEFGPGLLTSLKSTMVSTDALAALCVESGVADYFVCRSEAISSKLKVYTKALRLARADEHETSRKEARELRQYWKGIRPPKELADCFESLLGAILVSEGFDSRGCEIMYKKVMKPFFDKHIHVEEDVNPSAPSVLRNKLAKWKCRDVLVERTVNSPSEPNGALTQQCDIVVHGIVLARAEGPSRTAAYDMAEQLACEALDVDHEFIASNCDCHATSLEGGHAPARKQRRAALRMREELEETGAVEGLLGDLSSDTEDDEDDDDMDGVEIVEEEEADDEDEDSQGPGRSTRMGGRRHV
ncbi:hypothetical protein FRB96_006812 [Tulasnella sp. 330]|nr:hypothetical protein FRB96_006812 [Tulasnella sp. 330]